MTIRPLHDYVLIREIESQGFVAKGDAGLIFFNQCKEKTVTGTVLRTGPDVPPEESLSAGDIVYWPRAYGTDAGLHDGTVFVHFDVLIAVEPKSQTLTQGIAA
jgi:co-chaperonin GroES (HSP10)